MSERRYGQQKLDGGTFVGGYISNRPSNFIAQLQPSQEMQIPHHQGFDVHIFGVQILIRNM